MGAHVVPELKQVTGTRCKRVCMAIRFYLTPIEIGWDLNEKDIAHAFTLHVPSHRLVIVTAGACEFSIAEPKEK